MWYLKSSHSFTTLNKRIRSFSMSVQTSSGSTFTRFVEVVGYLTCRLFQGSHLRTLLLLGCFAYLSYSPLNILY